MSFPLASLLRGQGAETGVAADAGLSAPPWRERMGLVLGGVAWLLALIALATYDPADAAFTTSGVDTAVHNKVGRLGAWAADLAYFLFGFSAWWLLPVAARAWMASLARHLRGEPGNAAPAPGSVAVGLAMLMTSSTALEWSRLYQWETALPGHAGGVLGHALGQASVTWLGFAGSGVLWIALLVMGSALALRFSWLRTADVVGSGRERRALAVLRRAVLAQAVKRHRATEAGEVLGEGAAEAAAGAGDQGHLALQDRIAHRGLQVGRIRRRVRRARRRESARLPSPRS